MSISILFTSQVSTLQYLNISFNEPRFEGVTVESLKMPNIRWLYTDNGLQSTPGPAPGFRIQVCFVTLSENILAPIISAINSSPLKLIPGATTLSSEALCDKVFGLVMGNYNNISIM